MKTFYHPVNKGIFQEKTASSSPFGFSQNFFLLQAKE